MRYIIDKGDLYCQNDGDIIIGIGDKVSIVTLPLGCHPAIVGRVVDIKPGCLTVDSSTECHANVRPYGFKDIYKLEVIQSAFVPR